MKPTTRILTTLALAGGLSTALFECQAPKRQTLNPEQVHSNLVKTLTMDEGKRQWVYDDETGKRLLPGDKSKGKRTIGVGFNLERGPSAQEQIKSLERDYMKLYKGEASLTDDEINYLLNQDIQDSVADAQKFVGKENYDKLDTRAQEVVINMAFNLGYNGLSKFKKFKSALQQQDYDWAAMEMENSLWYYQTGNRAKRLVEKMGAINNSGGIKPRPWVSSLLEDLKYRVKSLK